MARKQTPCQKAHLNFRSQEANLANLRALHTKLQAKGEGEWLEREQRLLEKKIDLNRANFYHNLDETLNKRRVEFKDRYLHAVSLGRFQEARAVLREHGGQGYLLDGQGEKLPGLTLSPRDELKTGYVRGRAVLRSNNRCYLLDQTGQKLHAEGFAQITPDYPVYQAYEDERRVHLLNTEGERITKMAYRKIGRFVRGKAMAITQDRHCVFLGENGAELWNQRFDAAFGFENGRARVKLDGEEFYINEAGERIN